MPIAIAQIPGTGGMRGGSGGRGGRGSGDMGPGVGSFDIGPGSGPLFDMGPGGGPSRGDRGRGGPGSWMDREDLTDFQIDLILKSFGSHNPTEEKKLEDQRKSMSRDAFIQTLMRTAIPDYFQIMSDERHYTQILNWCEKYVSDEAIGIKALKEENYNLYKRKLDSLENKYRSIIYRTTNTPDELIPVLVKDLQLNTRQGELVWQIRIAENQEKKDSLIASLREVVSELYYLNIQQRTIQLKQIQSQIERLQKNLQFEMKQIETSQDPNVAEIAIEQRVEGLSNTNPSILFGGPGRGGRPGGGSGGRNNRMQQFSPPDNNDQNKNPVP